MNINDILKPYKESVSVNVGGHFGVVDNNKRNLLERSDTSVDNVIYSIVSTHHELRNNPEMIKEIATLINEEMQKNVKTR